MTIIEALVEALVESTNHLARLSVVDAAAKAVYQNNIRVIKEYYFCDVVEKLDERGEVYGVEIVIHCRN